MPIPTQIKLILGVCAIWLVASCPSWARDQEARFIEFPNDTDTLTFDLSTVQMIQPGRFTVIQTDIDNPDVMKFELKVFDTLKTYCARPDGKYPAPADLLTLGQPDIPIERIDAHTVTKQYVSWSYPYKRLHGGVRHVPCPALEVDKRIREELENVYRKSYAEITNGSRMKEVFDCKRGLYGFFSNENDDPSKVFHPDFVKEGTRGENYYLRVCYAVMHEMPYLPERPSEQLAAPPSSTTKQEPADGLVKSPYPAPPGFSPVPMPPASSPVNQHTSQLGTGFYISDGFVLTNAHVVKGCTEANIGASTRSVTARVVASDDDNDLALLRTAAHPPAIAALRLSVRQGEAVAAYGFPLPGLLASGGNLTTGNITALSGIGDDSRFLQISAPVQPGNSGGPLLDGGGNVIGIVEGKLNATKVATAIGDIPQNVNFAIKASVVATFLDNNRVNYRTGQLGAAHSPADIAEDARRFTVPVECDGVSVVDAERTTGPATPAKPAPPKGVSQLRQRSQQFIAALYSTLSGSTDEASATLNEFYADTVRYFGNEMSREQVMAKVQLSFARWSVRHYRPKEGSVIINCDEGSLTCAVAGVVQFDHQSPLRNERSTGEATFEYRLRFPSSSQQMPTITVEGGVPLKRSVQSLYSETNGSPLNFFDHR